MSDDYQCNIHYEIKNRLNKSRCQHYEKTRPCKAKRYKKLLKYECMSMGYFKMAKLFN